MSRTATLKGRISLDDSEFNKTLRRATDRAKKFGSQVASAVGTAAKASLLGIGAAGVGAAGGLIAAAKSAADLGGQLSDASAVTGIAAGKMLVLQQAFANAGMSGEGAAGVIAKLQASIGRAGFMSEESEEEISQLQDRIRQLRDMKSGMDPREQAKTNKEIAKSQERIKKLQSEARGVAQAFKRLGLDQAVLAQMDGADQLKAVMEALGKMATHSDKLAALRMLRLPPELMVLAKDPNAFKTSATMLGSLPGIMDQFADQFDRISDILNAKPGILFNQIGAGFLKELTGNQTLQGVLNAFESLDLTSIGEKIGAQAAALIDIIKNVVASNGGDVWKSLAVGMEFLSAKAMQMFVSATQIAAGAAMGAMVAIFSDEGGQLAASIASVLVGAFLFAGIQIKRIMESVIEDIEDQLKKSTAGKVLLGAKRGLATGLNPLASAKDTAKDIWGGITGKEKERLSLSDRLNAPIPLMDGMTIQELAQTTAGQASKATQEAGQFAKKLVEEITRGINEVRQSQGPNPANDAVDTARNRLINQAGPNGAKLFDQLTTGRPAVPINVPTPQQQRATPPPGMTWEFDAAGNKRGDTGPKQVELLEKVATLLDRNLTALQVA